MKKILFISICLLTIAAFTGCKKDNLAELDKGNTTLVLSANTESLTLNEKQRNKTVLSFNWTSGSNMGTNAAITYKLLIARQGTDFGNPVVFELGKTIYSYDFTSKTLNEALLGQLGAVAGTEINLESKIIATVLNDNVAAQTSPVVNIKVTPYSPVSATLFLVGSSTSAGWDNNNAIAMTEDADNPGLFTWQGHLGSGEFKFITTLGQWLPSYNKGGSDNNVVGRTTDDQADTKWSITDPGTYKVTVDIINLTFAKEKLAGPAYTQLFMVGSATPVGWDIGNAVELVQNPDNLYQFTYTGVMVPGEFKFPVNRNTDWGQDMLMKVDDTHIYLHKGGDPDDSKWSIEKKGYYTITLDLMANTISINRLQLYMVGSATPIGWDIGNAVQLQEDAADGCIFTYTGPMVSGEFKFPVNRNSDWGQNMYMKVDDTHMYLHIGGASDDNKWNIAEAGNYIITANVENLTISIVKN